MNYQSKRHKINLWPTQRDFEASNIGVFEGLFLERRDHFAGYLNAVFFSA